MRDPYYQQLPSYSEQVICQLQRDLKVKSSDTYGAHCINLRFTKIYLSLQPIEQIKPVAKEEIRKKGERFYLPLVPIRMRATLGTAATEALVPMSLQRRLVAGGFKDGRRADTELVLKLPLRIPKFAGKRVWFSKDLVSMEVEWRERERRWDLGEGDLIFQEQIN